MALRTRIHAALALVFGSGCLPTPEPDAGMTSSATSGTPSFGDLPPPDDGVPTTTSPDLTTTTTSSTSSSTSTTTDTTTGGGPLCGDGHLDPGEDCDLGPDNADDGACTLMCDPAVCGDGLLWAGHEECDFGPGNIGGHGGCNPDCTRAPHCGDGTVDAGAEECDLGALNGTGMGLEDNAPCGATCRWQGRLVFVTSALYDGALGGLPGADLKCRNLAATAGIDNAATFRAWLSDGNNSPLTRFDQVDLEGAPYILRSGRIVAADFAELIEKGPRTGLAVDETGGFHFEKLVWTNTSPFGEPFSPTDHCAGWTSGGDAFSARVGYNALELEAGPAWQTWRDERHWTSAAKYACSLLWRLYCFEDGYVED